MSLGQWSTTAANNATADPSINWQEGQAPSTVNDSARQMMADVATWFQSAEWLNLADTPTYINTTSFSIPGNRANVYSPGRRIRATVSAGTVYGTITASAFGSVTTVTIAADSGSLDSGLSEVDVGILQNQLTALIPAGTLIDFAGTSAPQGFLNCDGSAVSRTTYAGLFSAIGTAWGAGDGSTTFNLPDLRRKTTIGSGGTAVSGPANTVGSTGGEETHTLTAGELASHNHTVTDNGHVHSDSGHTHAQNASTVLNIASSGAQTGGSFNIGTGNVNTQVGFANIQSSTTGISINNSGGGGAHNNMQPSGVVLKCIKY